MSRKAIAGSPEQRSDGAATKAQSGGAVARGGIGWRREPAGLAYDVGRYRTGASACQRKTAPTAVITATAVHPRAFSQKPLTRSPMTRRLFPVSTTRTSKGGA